MPDAAGEALDARSPAQVRALAHPTRHRLLRALGSEGATVSQLSIGLAVNKGNVAHHLAVLEAAGLVRRGPRRTVRGGTEQYWLPVGRRIRFGAGDEGSATAAMLGTIADDISADTSDHLLAHRVLRLSAAQAAALRAHLDALVEELEPADPREQRYGVLVGVYRCPR